VYDRLDANYFLTLCEIATLVWVATHPMGLIAYFTSRRCKEHCADESRDTTGMAQTRIYH